MVEDDAALMVRIAKGDRSAMRSIYERHAPAARNFVRKRLNDPAEAADIVHDVMLDVWRSAAKFAGDSAVRTWILAIARHKTSDRLRRLSREAPRETTEIPDLPDEAPNADAIIAAAQVSQKIRDCLEQLSLAHKTALHLAFYEDLTYPEVAIVEGVSVGTIKSRVHHAKRLMMRCLGGRP